MNSRSGKTKITSADQLTTGFAEAFKGTIEPVQVSILYRLGIFIVAIFMVLLPLIYLAMILGVGYGILYHATENVFIIFSKGFGLYKLIAYLAPIVIGGILIYFMIKPLFTKTESLGTLYSLDPAKERQLFTFVENICDIVGAPIPRKININCDVNASASFEASIFSLITKDLNLTIGLPLVAGLNLQEFAGVLAHEFGHFSQGTGMRFSYIIRSINFWFARVLSEKTSMDEMLNTKVQEADFRIGIVLLVAKVFVWITSKILWLLMIIGHFMSSFLLRQMEFDADQYEIQLAGSAGFISTSSKIRLLGVAFQSAHQDLRQSWSEGKLADNLPALSISHLGLIPPKVQSEIEDHIQKEETGFFDTHPSDKERIHHAKNENANGIFHLDAPASSLFTNFNEISREVTTVYYKEIFGEQFEANKLVSTEQILAQQDEIREGDKILERYFQGHLTVLRPFILENVEDDHLLNREEIIKILKTTRESIVKNLPKTQEAFVQFENSDVNKTAALHAKSLLECDFKIKAEDFSLSSSTPKAADRAVTDAKSRGEEATNILAEFEKNSRLRLCTALTNIQNPKIISQIPDADNMAREYRNLVPVYLKIYDQFVQILKLRENYLTMSVLLANLQNNEENEKLIAKIRRYLRSTHEILQDMESKLSDVNYPFEHASGEITLAKHFINKLPAWEDLNELYLTTEEALDRFFSLYFRILGRFTLIAEKFETAMGFTQMAEPIGSTAKDLKSQEKDSSIGKKSVPGKILAAIIVVIALIIVVFIFLPGDQNEKEIEKEIRLSMIQVDNQSHARQIFLLLEDGRDFAELAKRYSIGPGKEKGGDLGDITVDELRIEFKSEVDSMKIGQFSNVIITAEGFFILLRTD